MPNHPPVVTVQDVGVAANQSIAASSLITIGTARARGGDAGGVADIERGAQIAESIHSPEASRGYNNLSVVLECLGDLEKMREAWKRSIEWADRVGSIPMARFARGTARWFAWKRRNINWTSWPSGKTSLSDPRSKPSILTTS